MSSPVIGDEAGIPVVANAVLGTPNRESIFKASSRTRADWSGAVFMIKRPVLQTGVHVGRLSQAWRRYDRSGDISTNVTAARTSALGRGFNRSTQHLLILVNDPTRTLPH